MGRSTSDVFSKISPEPVAAASLGQVYRATLRATGEEVTHPPSVVSLPGRRKERVTLDEYDAPRRTYVYTCAKGIAEFEKTWLKANLSPVSRRSVTRSHPNPNPHTPHCHCCRWR